MIFSDSFAGERVYRDLIGGFVYTTASHAEQYATYATTNPVTVMIDGSNATVRVYELGCEAEKQMAIQEIKSQPFFAPEAK